MSAPLLDDIQGLVCFARVVELGSFTRAAEAVGVSKSVISSRVANLETRLGEQLLLRTTRRVTATSAGARIYALARQVVDAATAATDGASDTARGIIRVSAPITIAHLHLARPIAAFVAANPSARVELLLDDRIVDLLDERIDVAVRITKLKDSGLVARRLARTPMHVCGSPAYLAARGRPSRPEDLLRHNCLRYALLKAEHEWRFYGENGRMSLTLSGNFETTNGTMLREAAIAGMGLAILPRFMIADALADGRLETVLDDFAPRSLGIYAVRRGKRHAPPLVAELVRHFEAEFRALPWNER